MDAPWVRLDRLTGFLAREQGEIPGDPEALGGGHADDAGDRRIRRRSPAAVAEGLLHGRGYGWQGVGQGAVEVAYDQSDVVHSGGSLKIYGGASPGSDGFLTGKWVREESRRKVVQP
jgi:hypothetical protein